MATVGTKHLRAPALVLALGAVALGGCGGSSDYVIKPRPPTPINISAYVSPTGVSVAPASFGAGPVVITIANQSGKSQQLNLSSDAFASSSSRRQQGSGPVTASGTAQMNLDLQPGTYQLKASSAGVAPATVHVGSQRAASQNELQQP